MVILTDNRNDTRILEVLSPRGCQFVTFISRKFAFARNIVVFYLKRCFENEKLQRVAGMRISVFRGIFCRERVDASHSCQRGAKKLSPIHE